MNKQLLKPLLFALVFLIAIQWLGGTKNSAVKEDIMLVAKSSFTLNRMVSVTVQNNQATALELADSCPKNPLKVEKYDNGQWIEKTAEVSAENCPSTALSIPAGKKAVLTFHKWNPKLFDTAGKYRLSLTTKIGDADKTFSKEIEIVEPNLFKKAFQVLFYKPILNILVFLIDILPHHNLGWGIIVLTLLIKLLLLHPNHKALSAQKRMQKVQPEIDALKLKYKDDQAKLSQETMLLWKKYKISPMDSCLPMLIQFPILIALFYVVKDGLDLIGPQVLYGPLQNFDPATLQTSFLGLIDLTKISRIVLPIVVGLLQFGQMKMSLAKNKNAATPPGMNLMMTYALPVMVGVFTASLPAAVGFYWGTSTLFGIFQQALVNRSKD
jgi:YidC/Oxa1 family membrane protein insertase